MHRLNIVCPRVNGRSGPVMFGSSGQDASWQIFVCRFINLEALVFETVIHMYLKILMPTTTTESDRHVALAYSSKLVSQGFLYFRK